MSDFLRGFASENEKKWFKLAKIAVGFLYLIALRSPSSPLSAKAMGNLADLKDAATKIELD
jgi:hypothetical protein